jgi:hypothetical protein
MGWWVPTSCRYSRPPAAERRVWAFVEDDASLTTHVRNAPDIADHTPRPARSGAYQATSLGSEPTSEASRLRDVAVQPLRVPPAQVRPIGSAQRVTADDFNPAGCRPNTRPAWHRHRQANRDRGPAPPTRDHRGSTQDQTASGSVRSPVTRCGIVAVTTGVVTIAACLDWQLVDLEHGGGERELLHQETAA